MKAEDVMARDVLTVTPTTSIGVAVSLMLRRKISGLPVLDAQGALVGILTEGDLLRRSETQTGARPRSRLMAFLAGPGRDASDYVHANSHLVGDLMSPDVATVSPEASLEEVVELMERRRIRRVPVVDGTRVVGIVSRMDLLRVLNACLSRPSDSDGSDRSIEAALKAELGQVKWGAGGNFDYHVQAGQVTFNGFIYDERTRKALIVAAQNIHGVDSVIDHMVWLDTATGMTVPGM